MTTKYQIGGIDTDILYMRKDKFTNNGLWAWGGISGTGPLGDNTLTSRSSPVQTVSGGTNWIQCAAINQSSFGIKTDGTLWCWGTNGTGQLGNNSTSATSSPVQTLAGGTNWKSISSGGLVSISAIKTDGTLWSWGNNSFGNLGDNTLTHRSSPVQTVTGGTNWKQVDSGYTTTAGIKTDGTLWLWGDNINGALGNNSTSPTSSPVQTVAGGTNWKQVIGGQYNTAGIKTDGTLWLWGNNSYGQLGNNSTSATSSPVQTVAGGTNWKQVIGGQVIFAAIKTNGTLWCWGNNSYGNLGDNTLTHRSSPVQTVAGGVNWKQGSGGQNFTTAIKTDGTLWSWGLNSFGELGNNSTSPTSSPVQTVAGGTNWKRVTASRTGVHTIAIQEI